MLESKTEEILIAQDPPTAWKRLSRAPRHAATSLWQAPLPNARFLIVSGAFWTVLLAITEPYKSLFYAKLGMSTAQIGGLVSIDLVVRSSGLLFSGWFMRTFGAKRMLVVADSLSWVVPYLILGMATRPWHILLAVLFTSLNAFASTPYNCMLAAGMPPERRTRAYAFMHIWNMAPALVMPLFAGFWLKAHTGDQSFLGFLRILFLVQAASMAIGILWRSRRLVDLPRQQSRLDRQLLGRIKDVLFHPTFFAAWAALVMQGVFQQVSGSFSSIYLTQSAHYGLDIPAWSSAIGAIGFALGILALQSRLSERTALRLAPVGLALHAASLLLLLLHPHPLVVLAISLAGGLFGSLYAAATSSVLIGLLPEDVRDHGFAICYVGVFLCGAALMPVSGAVLKAHPQSFPWIAGLSLALWGVGIAIAGRRVLRQS